MKKGTHGRHTWFASNAFFTYKTNGRGVTARAPVILSCTYVHTHGELNQTRVVFQYTEEASHLHSSLGVFHAEGTNWVQVHTLELLSKASSLNVVKRTDVVPQTIRQQLHM